MLVEKSRSSNKSLSLRKQQPEGRCFLLYTRYYTYVSVAYLSLGSNLGDRKINLRRAVKMLPPKVKVDAVSPVYETDPMYFPDQPKFYNVVVRGKTELTPEALLKHVKSIEKAMGRDSDTHNRPRIIDLDIMFYDDLVHKSPDLIIPHLHIAERAFVLVPLNDIAPKFIHPTLKATAKQMLEHISDWKAQVRRTNIDV